MILTNFYKVKATAKAILHLSSKNEAYASIVSSLKVDITCLKNNFRFKKDIVKHVNEKNNAVKYSYLKLTLSDIDNFTSSQNINSELLVFYIEKNLGKLG